jgi:HEAT repeat protein
LKDRAAADLSEGAFLLGIHGDLNVKEFLQEKLAQLQETDSKAKVSVEEALNLLESKTPAAYEPVPIDIYSLYPEEAELPIDLLSEEDRLALLNDTRSSIRARAAQSFFNQHPGEIAVDKLLKVARSDPDESVRARAWESLVDATEETTVVEAMLQAMRDPRTPATERAGILVGLALETDRKEVRGEIERLYREHPETRAKALEAMWRSLHPSFRDYFAPHLDDDDLETRRNAVWGVGYYSIKPSLDKLRKLFDDEELRSDALFAYALALPNEISKGRVRGLLSRIEKDAGGLSEIEERLVMTALDERLMLSGKEPFFYPED